MSNATATIEISTVNNFTSITLQPNEVHLQDFGHFNPSLGVENKSHQDHIRHRTLDCGLQR